MRDRRSKEAREGRGAQSTIIEEFDGLINKTTGKTRGPSQLAQVRNLAPTNEKKLLRRNGWRATALTGYRSLRRDSKRGRLLGVVNDALVQVDPVTGTNTPLGTLYGQQIEWAEADDGALVVSSEAGALIVDAAGVNPLRVTAPGAVSVMALDAPLSPPRPFNFGKTYDTSFISVVATYTSAGREGPPSPVAQIPVDPDVALVQLSVGPLFDKVTFYATTPGGGVFYRAAVSESGAVTLPMRSLIVEGGPACPTLGKQALPPGITKLAFFRGSLCAAVGNTIFMSEPGSPHLFDYPRRFITLRGDVRLMLKAKGALYIGTSDAVFRWDGERLEELVPEGVPIGQAGVVYEEGTEAERAHIWTARALYRTDPFEEVAPLTSVDPGIENRSSIVYTAGLDLMVSPFVGRRAGFNVKDEK